MLLVLIFCTDSFSSGRPHYVFYTPDWAQNAHSLTVQRGQNAHYVHSLYRV